MLAECRGEWTAVTHGVAYLHQYGAYVFLCRGVHQETQRAVEILPGAEHDGELACNLRKILAGKPLAAAELRPKQRGEKAARAFGQLGTHGQAALAPQNFDDRLFGRRFHQAGSGLAGGSDGGVAETRHLRCATNETAMSRKQQENSCPQSAESQTLRDSTFKSFLLLFFKKEGLPSTPHARNSLTAASNFAGWSIKMKCALSSMRTSFTPFSGA